MRGGVPASRAARARTAADYARRVAAGDIEFSWPELEGSAFARHPSLLRLLGESNDELSIPVTWRRRTAAALAGVFAFVVTIAPLIVPGVLTVGLRLDQPLTGYLAAAIVLAIAYVVQHVRQWIRASRRTSRATAQTALLAAVSVVFGVIAAWLATLIAIQRPQPLAWPAFVSIAAMTLAALMTVVVIRRGHPAAARGDASTRAVTPGDALRAGIAELSETEHQALSSDLDLALRLLVTSGTVSEADRDEARRVPLGGLARWRWAIERRGSRD